MGITAYSQIEASLERERVARVEAERVAAETIRDLYERQCETQLLRSVALDANEARSIEDALRAALAAVCRYAGWALGHVHLVDGSQQLVDPGIWHDEADAFSRLRGRTHAATGLADQAVAQRLTVWIEDLAALADVPFAAEMSGAGLRAAAGVPVLVGREVRAVLELFGDAPRALDGHFVDLMGQVGAVLARVIEREQAQRELHDANARLTRALVDLQDAQERIVQQERLRALGQMASGIAHDFNNALHPIVGFAELLLGDPAVTGQRHALKYLRNIITSATDAAAVVARLREFYRTREDEDVLVPVDLRPLVEQVAELTRPRWQNEALAAGIRIEVVTDLGPIPRIRGHEAELREAIMNLLLNAVDALPEGGTIVLRTRADGARAVVEVCDSGIGMSEEVRRHCLEPFYTTKGNRGSGLGLGMVYGITHRHDGALDIVSSPGCGTSVVLSFPAAARTDAEPAPALPQAAIAPLRLLVVDDKEIARDVLRALLEADGHEVDVVCNGADAVARLAEARFDAVLTDRSMPCMSGDELARTVKSSATPVRVIMITGFGVLMLSAGECPPGVDVVLPKPVTRTALRDALAAATKDAVRPPANR